MAAISERINKGGSQHGLRSHGEIEAASKVRASGCANIAVSMPLHTTVKKTTKKQLRVRLSARKAFVSVVTLYTRIAQNRSVVFPETANPFFDHSVRQPSLRSHPHFDT